jgi:putative heme transporter
VPSGLEKAATVAWRVLLVAAAIAVAAIVLSHLRLVVLPVIAALFISTILQLPVRRLKDRGWPDWLAALSTLLVTLLLFSGLVVLMAPSVTNEVDQLADGIADGVEEVGDWLFAGPFGLSEAQVRDYVEQAGDQVRDSAAPIASGVVGGALLAIEIVVGALLTLVLLFFFLKDGGKLWAGVLGLVPAESRERTARIGTEAWDALQGYLRGITVVAAFDAVFIGLALWALGVPLVIPLATLTFFAAYIPIAGAFTAGIAAVLVALVSEGVGTAIAVTVAIIAVQQIESNLLHPVVVGRSVRLHPVVILLSVMAGAITAGIVGAFLAVPIAAVVTRIIQLRDEIDLDAGMEAAEAEAARVAAS